MDSNLDEIRELKIEKKVYLLRHRLGNSWNEVSSKVSEEFKINISSKKVQEIYDKHISRSKVNYNATAVNKRESKEVNDQWMKDMKALLGTIKGKALKHLEIADELLIEQYNAGNTKAYFRNLPVAISLFRSLLDQANFLGKRLEKIEINQNNFILNETQILQLVNKKMSQREKEQGYVIHPGTGEIIKKKKKVIA